MATKEEARRLEEEERAWRIEEDKRLKEKERETERERSIEDLTNVRNLEEDERKRRIAIDDHFDQVEKERSLTNKAYSTIEEEDERVRRIAEDDYSKQREQEYRDLSKAEVHIKEEEERARRIALDQYPQEVEKERSATNKAWTVVKEEEERARRIAEDDYAKELEADRREQDLAYVHIKEEEERARRVALERYPEAAEKEHSIQNRKLSRKLEEAEKERRVADFERKKSVMGFSGFGIPVPIGSIYERIPKEAATAARERLHRKMRPEAPAFKPSVAQRDVIPITAPKTAPMMPTGVPSGTSMPFTGRAAPTTTIPTTGAPVGGFGGPTQAPLTRGQQMPASGMGTGVKPLIAVFGGTGKQGGSVAKALLRDGRWNVRILTRNQQSRKAMKLSTLFAGFEVMQGNMHNVEDLRRFLTGCYGCFALTNFWDPESMFKEEMLGRQIVQIAKECGVRHFIWSTLPHVQKLTGGKYNVPHFTDKAKVNKYVRQAGFETWSFVMPAFYYQNFAEFFPPRKEGNQLVWTLPMGENTFLSAVDVRDTGAVVLQQFINPQFFHNKKIPVVGDHMHPQDYIIKFALTTKNPAKVELILPEEYAKSGKPGAEEMAEMFKYFSECTYYGNYDWTLGKQIYPAMKTWDQFVRTQWAAVQTPTQGAAVQTPTQWAAVQTPTQGAQGFGMPKVAPIQQNVPQTPFQSM